MPVAVSVVVNEPPEHVSGGAVLLHDIAIRRTDWKTTPILAFPLKGKETGVVAIQPRLRVHQCQHTFHHLIDVQAGGIEEDGVFGRPQRRHRALGITGVAGENLA